MDAQIYFMNLGGRKHGPLSRADIDSLYGGGIVDLNWPVAAPGFQNLTVRDLILPSADQTIEPLRLSTQE